MHFATPEITEADVEAVSAVLRSGWLTTGEKNLELETALSEYLGGVHVVAVSSCTAALQIATSALCLSPGARVGVPTWTFLSSALVPWHLGLQPVLLDVDESTLNLCPAALERALDEGLDAVIGVHFGGVPLAPEIHELCARYEVPLVEDAAHAFGARDHRGGLIAGDGTAGACFSFYATKNLTSGEGGALATTSDQLAEFARANRQHGMSADAWNRYRPDGAQTYDLDFPGIKGNLSDVLAALALSQFARFDANQRRRREVLDAYRAQLGDLAALRFAPPEQVDGSADHLAVLVLDDHVDRDGVRAALKDDQIATSVHFRPLHHFTWFQRTNVPTGPGGLPVAERLASRALSLPLHPGLTDDQVERVTGALRRALST